VRTARRDGEPVDESRPEGRQARPRSRCATPVSSTNMGMWLPPNMLRMNAAPPGDAHLLASKGETKTPVRPCDRTGAEVGVGVRHALFPICQHYAPQWAAGSPTLFSTASGVIGLAAGPSSALRSLDCRVRPLCPLRTGGCAARWRTGSRHDHLLLFASEPVLPGTATTDGSALARVDGSDLLPLRLHCSGRPATRFVASPALRKGSRLAERVLPGNGERFVAP
jgi:hypothetical protein